jgi:hypothetical protein
MVVVLLLLLALPLLLPLLLGAAGRLAAGLGLLFAGAARASPAGGWLAVLLLLLTWCSAGRLVQRRTQVVYEGQVVCRVVIVAPHLVCVRLQHAPSSWASRLRHCNGCGSAGRGLHALPGAEMGPQPAGRRAAAGAPVLAAGAPAAGSVRPGRPSPPSRPARAAGRPGAGAPRRPARPGRGPACSPPCRTPALRVAAAACRGSPAAWGGRRPIKAMRLLTWRERRAALVQELVIVSCPRLVICPRRGWAAGSGAPCHPGARQRPTRCPEHLRTARWPRNSVADRAGRRRSAARAERRAVGRTHLRAGLRGPVADRHRCRNHLADTPRASGRSQCAGVGPHRWAAVDRARRSSWGA